MQSWRALDSHLCHLHLMMSLDCPLTIRHKKGGVHMDGDRGRFFEFLELWSFRLYLGASHCTYFFAHNVFILMSLFFISCI